MKIGFIHNSLVLLSFVGIAAFSTKASAMDDSYAEAEICEWPTTVFLDIEFDQDTADHLGQEGTRCTGSYVGSGVVVSAGHCLAGAANVIVSFGEDGLAGEWNGDGVDCLHHPGGGRGNGFDYYGPDIAFCIIDTDIDHNSFPEPPKIPIMVPNGCEADYIRHKLFGNGWNLADVTYTGMGLVDWDSPDIGIKRYADGEIVSQMYSPSHKTQVIYGLAPEPDINTGIDALKPGDSGAPHFFQMANPSRRVIGTHKLSGNVKLFLPAHPQQQLDYFGVVMTPTPLYLRWLESASGRDLSPCHSWSGVTNSWSFTGGSGCGAGYEASPLGGPSSSWDDSSGAITGCAATDMLTSGTQCAGWTRPWTSGTPTWSSAHPAKSNADGLVEWAISGTQSKTLFESTGLNEVYGAVRDDLLVGTANADEIFAGEGDDYTDAGAGNDQIHGGMGNDRIDAGDGADVIHGFYGMDEIFGGDGDDIVIIMGGCELEANEIYDGGSGTDTLITPMTVLELTNRNIAVWNFETIVTTHQLAQATAC